MAQKRLYGLIAAPFTAVGGDGNIDLERIESQVQSLVASGVRGGS